MKKLFCTALFCSLASAAFAAVKLPALFSDHAVIARKADARIFGYADPGEKVTVTMAGKEAITTADKKGYWCVTLDLSKAKDGPYTLKVNDKTVKDVLTGEVWLASGQSNMQFSLGAIRDRFPHEIAKSADNQLRFFQVNAAKRDTPQKDLNGKWVIASPRTSSGFSAVAYFFAKKLRAELKTPVGVLNAAVGGSPIEAWFSDKAVATIPELIKSAKQVRKWQEEYPPKYTAAQAAWEKKTNRQDRPHNKVPDSGWVKRTLRYALFTGHGGAWMRRSVDLTKNDISKGITVNLGALCYPAEIWVNGKKIAEHSSTDIALERVFSAKVPASALKVGANEFAFRYFNSRWTRPIPQPVRIGDIVIPQNAVWEMNNEHELPRLTNEVGRSQPLLPAARFSAPGSFYNGMIAPMVPAKISGMIWYQGEANAGHSSYRKLFQLFIKDMRTTFRNKDLPFYFCQLAAYQDKIKDPNPTPGWVKQRENQRHALALPHTGMAVLTDCGEAKDIHPHDKQTPGLRLAACALADTYGKKVAYKSPYVASVKKEGTCLRVSFTDLEGGLVAKPVPEQQIIFGYKKQYAPLVRNSPNTQIEGFALCGADKKWYWADKAVIDGETVVVSSAKVPDPVAVRYNWSNNPSGNLYNKAGLPVAPFESK